ncbi:MAG: DUF4870 domain-containing protein [Planctomycetaceae bacterium]|jgi:uncharacterized Tic20 family protein|nr:DUF4870 domain-containing protein [Planctomycetaceae bacterium]
MSNENVSDNFGDIPSPPEENPQPNIPNQKTFWGMTENTYCMLMNLIQLLPGWGMILTIVMWVMNKDGSPQINQFGKNATNWVISFVIYCITATFVNALIMGVCVIISFMLQAPFVLFGYWISGVSFFVLGIISVVSPIIAAVKANKGIYWKYPLSIQFFK